MSRNRIEFIGVVTDINILGVKVAMPCGDWFYIKDSGLAASFGDKLAFVITNTTKLLESEGITSDF